MATVFLNGDFVSRDKAMLSAFIRESDEVNYWDVRRAVRDMANLIA